MGARLTLFDPELSLEAEAEVCAVGKGELRCQVFGVRRSDYRPHPIALYQALGKGAKPQRIVAEATALGLAGLTFVESERVVSRPDAARSGRRRERWRRIAVEAARQSERGDLPAIHGPLPLASALTRVAPGVKLLLHPLGDPLVDRLGPWSFGQTLSLLVGPEGGFAEEERALAIASGFLPTSLGNNVLRTELAATAAMAVGVAFASARGMLLADELRMAESAEWQS